MRRRTAALLAVTALLSGCREGDGPADPSVTDARIYLMSSPNGAQIAVDGRDTGQLTPDTVALRRGDRAVVLRLDSAGFTYDYGAILKVERTDSVIDIELPLGFQCATLGATCLASGRRHHDVGTLRFAANALGSLFHWGGNAQGIIWPSTSTNNYASSGMPVIAAREAEELLALGVYDQNMLVGRPAPRVTRAGGAFRLEQEAWVLPPLVPGLRSSTIRGVRIDEEVIGHDDVDGVLVIRLTFTNILEDTLVHRFAPHIPEVPATFEDVWIGYAIDPDIGVSEDDWLSYDPALDMVFAYDSDFSESNFIGPDAGVPGLVGLRILEAPAGTTAMLNSWIRGGDWAAGTFSEVQGYGILSGEDSYEPEHADARIGHMPPDRRDVRMSVTVGPLTLAPGGQAEVVLAVAVATPAAGTFTSGVLMQPGDPFDTTRPLYAAAADLRARMIAAETLPDS